jgi:pimeloyl-ACP methyl ester carboxylesterase
VSSSARPELLTTNERIHAKTEVSIMFFSRHNNEGPTAQAHPPGDLGQLPEFVPDDADPRQLPRKLAFTPEGRRLGYFEGGSGPPLILIPGMMATLEDMVLGPFDRLAQDHRVLAFDRPGYGKSDRRRLMDASPWAQATLIRDAVQGLGVERPIVVGHSYGAAVALAWAMAYPGELGGIVAISPIAFPSARLEALVLGPRATLGAGDLFNITVGQAVDPPLMSAMYQYVFRPHGIPAHFREKYPFGLAAARETTMAVAEDSALQQTELWRSAFAYPTCRTPVHVLAGASDTSVSHIMHALPMTQVLPDARLTCLPGMGHMLHHFAIDEVAAAVAEVTARATSAQPEAHGG